MARSDDYDLTPGIFEQLLTPGLEQGLAMAGPDLDPSFAQLSDGEAADRIALHLARTVEQAISELPESRRKGISWHNPRSDTI